MENSRKDSVAPRVLYVEASMGGVVGGSLTGILHLLGGLDRARFSALVALYQRKSMMTEVERSGVPVRVLNGMRPARAGRLPRRMLNLASVVFPNVSRLAKLIAAEKPALVHACNGFRSNFDVELACRITRVPCVTHVKGFTLLRPEEKFVANRVAGAIWMTNALKDYYDRQRVRPALARTIYDGLDTSQFVATRPSASVRMELGVPTGAPCLAVAGNIQSWKGQKVVVEAVSRLSETLPDLHCLVIGGVHRNGLEYYRELREAAEQTGLGQRVVFTGFRHDVPSLFAAADIIVHSSVRPEPFGRVIIEGMSLGKPVVATAAGGVPEIITSGVDGLLVPPGDAGALAEAIGRLIAEPGWRRSLGEAGKRLVARRFSVERHVEEVQDFYWQLLRGGRSRAGITGVALQAIN